MKMVQDKKITDAFSEVCLKQTFNLENTNVACVYVKHQIKSEPHLF